jgi:L,D-transpeptidase-like protein
MRNLNGTRYQAEQAKLICTILFLCSFPAYAQIADKRLLLVSIPDHQMALIENGQIKKVYSVATGKESTPSPSGSFHIVVRVTDPTYYHEGKVIAPGPHNPLGNRWMGLDLKGYGIHGTNAPSSIGKSASHGCIRMAKKDLEEIFSLVKVGDEVEIRGERDEQTSAVFGTGSLATETTVAVVKTAAADDESVGQ